MERTKESKSVTIGKSRQEVSDFWADPLIFKEVLDTVDLVQNIGQDSFQISLKNIGNKFAMKISQKNQDIVVYLLEGKNLDGKITVEFKDAPSGRGTEVRLIADGNLVVFLGGSMSEQVPECLRKSKQLIETGEIPTTKGQPHGPSVW